MRFPSRVFAAAALSLSLSLAAQTYTPKEIHLEGVPESDVPGLLKILNLQPGTDITKQQIEDGLQRLGDTNLFSNIQYTVNARALTIQLSTTASAKPLPVRFANFVWWQPAELEKLVEARVPVYHGELPVNGTLMDQVQAALIALLKEKGISGKVTASEVSDHPGAPVTATAIYLTSPIVQLGDLRIQGADPALQSKINQRTHTLGEEDFDIVVTSASLQQNIADVYQNAGYLDITTDPPTFAAPRKDPTAHVQERYLVDATTTAHPGQLYRIATLNFPSVPPLSPPALATASGLKTGDPASSLQLRIADGEVKKAYSDKGYLGAIASHQTAKDAAAHTVTYTFAVTPGELYRLASIDTSALPTDQQAALSRTFHPNPGVIADQTLTTQVFRTLADLGITKSISVAILPDHHQHTVVYALKPKSAQP